MVLLTVFDGTFTIMLRSGEINARGGYAECAENLWALFGGGRLFEPTALKRASEIGDWHLFTK